MPSTFGVVDLFAGPGGLGEGFASFEVGGHLPFQIGISVEKEESAHRTLTLRAFLREYKARYDKLPKKFIDFHAGLIHEPDWETIDINAWNQAIGEARALELGTKEATTEIDIAITKLKKNIPIRSLSAVHHVKHILWWAVLAPKVRLDMFLRKTGGIIFSVNTFEY